MFKFDKRILYIVVGIYVLINVINRLNNTDSMIALIMSLPAILVAITFHEYAHAFAADKLGDKINFKSTKTYRYSWICIFNCCRVWLGKTCRGTTKKF